MSKGDTTATGIACPMCEAPMGGFCITSSGAIANHTHAVRIQAWIDACNAPSEAAADNVMAYLSPARAQDNVRSMLNAVINDGATYHIHANHDPLHEQDPVAVVIPFDLYRTLRQAAGT